MILQDFAEKQSSAKEILQRKSWVLISEKWIPAQSELHWQKISQAGSTIPQAGVKLPVRCLQIKQNQLLGRYMSHAAEGAGICQ